MKATVTLGFKFLMEDGTYIEKNLPVDNSLLQWSVFCTAVTLNKILALDAALSAQLVVSFAVSLNGDGVPFVGPYKYEVDYRASYRTYTLLYRSSLGALESLTLRGQVDFEAAYEREGASRTVPPSHFNGGNLLPQTLSENTQETQQFKGDTGFLPQSSLEKLRDLFLSPQRFEFLNNRFVPIVMSNTSAKWYTNRNSLYSVQVEWARAFSNSFFTPENFIPVNDTCPSVESFYIRQVSSNMLAIMYSLPAPYDRIQVSIEDGYGISTFTYTGNTQSILQPYDLSQIAQINSWARVLCDENTSPISAGPILDAGTLVINNNLPPVATDDTFTISSGYTSAISLPGSVLTNDYDPDGGVITCVSAINESTHAGGTYSINGSGQVQYRAPSSSFSGQDYFDYTIQDSDGAEATARAYINVGTTSLIYVKMMIESKTDVDKDGVYTTTTTTGKVYLRFFRDAAATVPLDAAGMGITVALQLKYTTKTKDGDPVVTITNVPVAAGSYSTVAYDGELLWKHEKKVITFTETEYRKREYTLQPGNGYIAL